MKLFEGDMCVVTRQIYYAIESEMKRESSVLKEEKEKKKKKKKLRKNAPSLGWATSIPAVYIDCILLPEDVVVCLSYNRKDNSYVFLFGERRIVISRRQVLYGIKKYRPKTHIKEEAKEESV